MQHEHRRRRYFIDPVFQMDFILRFCLVVIVSSLLIGIFVFLLSQNSTTVAIENTHVFVKRTSDFILPVLAVTVLVVTAFSAVVVLILTLFVSHKIAGPIYRLKEEIKAVTQGDLTRKFQIRQKDQMQDLAGNLKGMGETLCGKHRLLKSQTQRLHEFLEEKKYQPGPTDQDALRQMIQDLENTLDYFKIS